MDLIDRQAAIDAVSRGCKELRGIFADCEKNLNELPSAESEQRKVAEERYEDLCEYFTNDQDAIKAILHDRKEFKAWLERMHWHVMECNRMRRELDAQKPERKKGRWIDACDTKGVEYYRCPECGTYIEKIFFGFDYDVNFCPNCGSYNGGE